ncbi:hypothetical protein [Planctomicrobium piriforme]|uniref:Kazal-type serine protease inhibitor domain-containing protein n=1 Tax=Planctomicrobium piriforme TaxID=1576369 RepID=A0A1I3GY94_9PLAN|nr:hypothetical protein [Planctomicrobium piriforme]SFI28250.1 hypothetical protein SAMN05421753_107171 [Planctomicrobium piriforme]
MTSMKFLGAMFLLSGGVSCLLAFDRQAQADNCQASQAFSPAFCSPGHQEPPPHESASCQTSSYFWCIPSEEGACSKEGYGYATPGQCNFFLSEATLTRCFENYIPRNVTLHFHRANCQFFEGSCQCVWLLDEYAAIQVPICDCTEM